MERCEVHVDVDGDAVVAASVADLEAECGDLRLCAVGAPHIDAGRVDAASGGDAACRKPFYHGTFDAPDELAHAEPRAREVEQQVGDELARAVIGHLSAAVDLQRRDAVVAQQVLAAPGESERVDRRMLGQPDFVLRAGVARVGERLHRTPRRDVVGASERAHHAARGLQRIAHRRRAGLARAAAAPRRAGASHSRCCELERLRRHDVRALPDDALAEHRQHPRLLLDRRRPCERLRASAARRIRRDRDRAPTGSGSCPRPLRARTWRAPGMRRNAQDRSSAARRGRTGAMRRSTPVGRDPDLEHRLRALRHRSQAPANRAGGASASSRVPRTRCALRRRRRTRPGRRRRESASRQAVADSETASTTGS